MKCPVCGNELEQETYYSYYYEETSYFNYCPVCNYDDYPEWDACPDKREDVKELTENKVMETITKSQAKEFYRDLCGTVYGNANKTQCGIMPVCLIADHMRISMEEANTFCDAMVKYGITERSNGMIVV